MRFNTGLLSIHKRWVMRRKISPSTDQLTLPFIKVMDRKAEKKARRDREREKKRWADGLLKHMVEDLPPINEEVDVLLMGIRMSRHVHEFECQRCKLGCWNHCPTPLGNHLTDYNGYCPIKVCIKDYFRWLVHHGYKAYVQEIFRTYEGGYYPELPERRSP